MSELRKFIKICKKSQVTLKNYLAAKLAKYYPVVVFEDGYIYAKGTDVLLTAHMDTVHDRTPFKVNVQKKKGKTVISSPQGIGGDDRCGIYMILNILETTDYRPSVLFCEDEEIGGVGSNKFCKSEYADELKELKYFIELDRANANDAVFYDCGNVDFQRFVQNTTGYKEAWGSFSDISNLSPETDIASVNLSCGYYKAHTLDEYVVFEEMQNSIEATIELLAIASEVDKFDYQPITKSKFDWYDDWCSAFNHKASYRYDEDDYEEMYGMEFEYLDPSGKEEWDYVDGESEAECLGTFFVTHPKLCYNDLIDMIPYYYDKPYKKLYM